MSRPYHLAICEENVIHIHKHSTRIHTLEHKATSTIKSYRGVLAFSEERSVRLWDSKKNTYQTLPDEDNYDPDVDEDDYDPEDDSLDIVGMTFLSKDRLITWRADKEHTVWNTQTNAQLSCLYEDHFGCYIENIIELQDERVLVHSNDSVISIYEMDELKSWKISQTVEFPQVTDFRKILPITDNRIIIVTKRIFIWNLSKGQKQYSKNLVQLAIHTNTIHDVAQLPTGELVSCSYRTICIYDLHTNACPRQIRIDSDIHGMCVTLNNELVLWNRKHVLILSVYDYKLAQPKRRFKNIDCVQELPDGQLLIKQKHGYAIYNPRDQRCARTSIKNLNHICQIVTASDRLEWLSQLVQLPYLYKDIWSIVVEYDL